MGERGQEKVVKRWEKEDWRKETGERRQEIIFEKFSVFNLAAKINFFLMNTNR